MDKSIYESSNTGRQNQRNGTALGRITHVDVLRRVCRVKTFFGPPHLMDLDCNNVQWVDADTNSEGDESTAIPREGSMGIVHFIEGEAFVHGFINALKGKQGAVTGNETAKLVKGDKIIATRAGNRVIVRTNGSIEFTSKETLKTVYIPTDSRIIELCRNLNFKTDGGYINWEVDDIGTTLHTVEYRTNIARTGLLFEERGSVGGTTVFKQEIGPGIPGVPGITVPTRVKEYDLTGATKEAIGPGVATITIDKTVDGSIKHDIFSDFSVLSKLGNFLASLDVGDATILAKLGSILVEATTGKIDVHALQNVSVLSDLGDVSVKATAGKVEVNGSLGKLVLTKGQVALGGPTAELLDLVDQLLTALKNAFLSAATETHIGNLGYTTSPPLNAADYLTAVALITQIQVLLKTIKGSL